MAAMRPFPETHTRVQMSIQAQTHTPSLLSQLKTQVPAQMALKAAPVQTWMYVYDPTQFNQIQMPSAFLVPSSTLQPLSGRYGSAGKEGKKRGMHSANEKRYRESINSLFGELRELLNIPPEVPKPAVLKEVIENIRSSQQMNHRRQPEETTNADSEFDEELRIIEELFPLPILPSEMDELMMESKSTPDIAQRPASSSEEGSHTSPAPASVQEPAANYQSFQLFPRPDEGEDSAPHRETEGTAARAPSNAMLTLTNSTSQHDEALRHTGEIWRSCNEKIYNESLQFQQSMINILKLGGDPARLKSEALSLIDERFNLFCSMCTDLWKLYSDVMKHY